MKRWAILKKHVNNVVKYPCNTRWESKIASVKVVRYELPRILCALAEVGEGCTDSKSAADISGINRSIFSFEFILITIIWFEVLSRANPVSKVLQSTDMIIDIAVAQLDSLESFTKDFRKTGFTKCLDQLFLTGGTRTTWVYEEPKQGVRSTKVFRDTRSGNLNQVLLNIHRDSL